MQPRFPGGAAEAETLRAAVRTAAAKIGLRVQSIEMLGAKRHLFQVVASSQDEVARRYVAKACKAQEWRVQTLVSRGIADLTAPVLAHARAHSAGPYQAVLLMDQLPDSRSLNSVGTPAASYASFVRTLDQLARLHARFLGAAESPGGDTIGAAVLAERIDPTCGEILESLGLLVEDGLRRDLAAAASILERVKDDQHSLAAGYRTLIHGDFTPANILAPTDGRPLLIDWGDAGWGPLAWDVAMLDPGALRCYARALSRLGVRLDAERFGREVAAAARARTALVIGDSLANALGGSDPACVEASLQAVFRLVPRLVALDSARAAARAGRRSPRRPKVLANGLR